MLSARHSLSSLSIGINCTFSTTYICGSNLTQCRFDGIGLLKVQSVEQPITRKTPALHKAQNSKYAKGMMQTTYN